jgi:stage II sporulation protein D
VRKGKGFWVLNRVDLEEYVKGVVPAEVSSTWHPEMLKAQAVAARTYALYQQMLSATREYDVAATVQDQVYRGKQGIDAGILRAVEETRGLVITYQDAPIYAAFSSTAAGLTEDAMNVWSKDYPYLKGVECPFDLMSPYYQWKSSFKLDTLEQGLRQQGFSVGTIATMTPLSFSRGGRVTKLRILHSGGELVLRGEELRKAVGYTIIPSTQFAIESIGRDVVLSGFGAGHAVGMCQWGAKELAELGYPFSTILQYYYPGTELRLPHETFRIRFPLRFLAHCRSPKPPARSRQAACSAASRPLARAPPHRRVAQSSSAWRPSRGQQYESVGRARGWTEEFFRRGSRDSLCEGSR